MIRRLILVSAAIVTGTLSFASQSQAAPSAGEVDFTGTIPGQCAFTNSRNGIVALKGDYTLGSNPVLYTGGATGKIDISCSTATVLTVDNPVQTAGFTTTTTNIATVNTSAGKIDSPAGTTSPKSVVLAPGFTQAGVTVDVENTATGKIFAGNYAYKVLITASPN
jgi:hypothetical protein